MATSALQKLEDTEIGTVSVAEDRLMPVEGDTDSELLDKRNDGNRRGLARIMTDLQSLMLRDDDKAGNDQRFYLTSQSRWMALFLLLAYLISAVIAQGFPIGISTITAILSIGLFACNRKLVDRERSEENSWPLRSLFLIGGIILPMACAGYTIADWVMIGLPWQWAVATLVCINAASAALLGMRIVSLFCGKIAIWTAFALVEPSPLTLLALIAAGITLVLIARLQWIAAEELQQRRATNERLAARAEDILRSFEESGQGWFWETDRRGLLTYISPKVADVLGKTASELCGRPLTAIVDSPPGMNSAERTLAFHLSARSAFQDVELRAACAGDERWWALTGHPVYDQFKNFCGFRGHGSDLTEKRRSEQHVARLAHYDPLTGLANRVQMSDALSHILAAPRERDRACAVLMLDLDRFKQVNDTLGHPAGDALLKQVAQRLERTLDGTGRCGRLGGDEFQVLIPGHHSREKLSHTAGQVISSLSQPYSVAGHSVVIGASVGIAVAPDDGTTSEALTRNVDLALYAAKGSGRGCHRFYAEDLHAAAEERSKLEQDLRDALARDDLKLFYQPVVCAATEKIVGFEALMRWHHSRRGWLSPAKFIPVAEDAGLIDQIGQWALRKACADLKSWPKSIRCAVNVSPLQFANPELPKFVASALAKSGVDPSRLELEITESVFLNDNADTDAMFNALKRVGVRLALDDFGTGYSSLGYLKKAPFDKIKIDQSFVRGATEQGSRNGAIIASITSLAEALDMDTTAEGVETFDELELVRLLGCSHVQGFIYYEPMDAAAATLLVAGDLTAEANGPQAARSPRHVMLRRAFAVKDGKRASVTIRNISECGAMIEGVPNVVAGNTLEIEFGGHDCATAVVRWCSGNRCGVEFPSPLERCDDGTLAVLRLPNQKVNAPSRSQS